MTGSIVHNYSQKHWTDPILKKNWFEDEFEENEGWRHIEAKNIVANWIRTKKLAPIKKNIPTKIYFEYPVGRKWESSRKTAWERCKEFTTPERFNIESGELILLDSGKGGVTTKTLERLDLEAYIVFDLAIGIKIKDKAYIDYGIEIVDTNPCNATKKEKLLRLYREYGIKVFEINVNDVLEKHEAANLPISRWLTPQTSKWLRPQTNEQ